MSGSSSSTTLSKIESGQIDIEETAFNLPDLVRATRELFRPVASGKGLDLEVRVNAPLPWCMGDPVRIRQILVNLIANALKFTDQGRVTVDVAIRNRDGHVFLEFGVTDTGIGMSAEALDRLFQAFVQADSSTTRRFGGTGLGLAISKRLCDQMGGTIRVESRLGRGTTFRVALPTRNVRGPAEEPVVEPDDFDTAPLHVLVVEDNATNQLVFSLYLKKMGMTFDIAGHGADALRLWEEKAYDVVLMDIEMPVLDGFEAARELRRREKALSRRPVPIIALSADARPENRDRAGSVGMNGFATKPLDVEKLDRLVRDVVRRSEAESGRDAV